MMVPDDNAAVQSATGRDVAPQPRVRDVRHVLIVNDFACINGGQAKVAIDSASLLADRGIQVTFFAACGPIDDALKRPEIEVVCLNQADILSDPNRLRAMTRGIWNRSAARRLAEVALRFDARTTVLHCHGYAKALSPAIGPVLADGPLASVYTMHEYFLACPNGAFYDFTAENICRRRPLGYDCLTTNCDARKPLHKVWRVARQMATHGPGRMTRGFRDVIYISETQRRIMAPFFPPSTALHYVPNPIPSTGLPRIEARQNDDYLFVGRLAPEKGCRLFAEAARKIGVRAIFVGDGSEREAIQRINPEAEIVGWQSPESVQEHLAGARALVFPSVWYETFGLVAFEALARGVPVVCGSWNAASELILDGVNGVLFSDANATALAAAMQRVASLSGTTVALPVDLSRDRHYADLMRVYGALKSPTGRDLS